VESENWKGITLEMGQLRQRDYWPTSSWRTTTPQKFGLEAERFIDLHQYAQEEQRVHSLLLVYSGYIVFEEYYHGWSQNNYHNVNSVTKSVTSALVGIALRQGMLDDLHQPVLSFFPEYACQNQNKPKQAVTLRHLLYMSSGFVSSSGEIETFLEHSSSVEKILDRPVQYEPGQVFAYDDLDAHLISLILNRITGISTAVFAQTSLFAPLGIWYDEQGQPYPWKHGVALADRPHPWGLWNEQDDALWSIDRQGYHIGGFGLQLTTREMAKFGYLYLNQGRWDGQIVLPATYVQDSLSQHIITPKDDTTHGEGYGYLWYLPHWWLYRSFWAIGFGGQVIACFPDLDVVVAMTAQPDLEGPPPHRKIISGFVMPILDEIASTQG
jgi:CubicO group peptidase (beta-lactamase class C family)